jgi:hypothetical protein
MIAHGEETSLSLKTQSFLINHKVQKTAPNRKNDKLFPLCPLSKRKLSLKSATLKNIRQAQPIIYYIPHEHRKRAMKK